MILHILIFCFGATFTFQKQGSCVYMKIYCRALHEEDIQILRTITEDGLSFSWTDLMWEQSSSGATEIQMSHWTAAILGSNLEITAFDLGPCVMHFLSWRPWLRSDVLYPKCCPLGLFTPLSGICSLRHWYQRAAEETLSHAVFMQVDVQARFSFPWSA